MNNSGDKIIKQQVDNMQVSFDKEAAWMRLQDRLESKDEKKGYFHMGWVAAAVVLVATVLWYSLSGDTKQPVVNTTPEITQPISVEEPKKEIIAPVVAEKKKNVIVYQKKKVSITLQQKEIKEVVKEIIPEPIIVKEEIVPIQETPKIVSAPKPKMKTVHINEVMQEQRIEERMNQSRYAGERNFLSPKEQYPQENYQFNSHNKKAAISELEEEYRLLQN